MDDNNLPAPAGPVETTPEPQTYESQVEDISNLLEDPATDLPEDDAEPAAEPEAGDILDEAEAEDVDEDDTEEPDGPDEPEVKGGRFAPDTAKVRMEDGTTITIAELKRNNLYQRGFTEKTQALSREKETFESERKQVTEYAQSLAQTRDYLIMVAQKNLPPKPEPFQGAPMDDYAAYLEHLHAEKRWNDAQAELQTLKQQQQAEVQKKQGETQKERQKRILGEQQKLVEAYPILKDPEKRKQFWGALETGASEHFGIPPELTRTITDHRMVKVLRDALAYRKIKSGASKVAETVSKKPMVGSGKRAAPSSQEVKGRQARSERLRNSGSFDDGVAALQDLDL